MLADGMLPDMTKHSQPVLGIDIGRVIVELHRKKRDLADSLLDESHAAATLGAAELRALLEG